MLELHRPRLLRYIGLLGRQQKETAGEHWSQQPRALDSDGAVVELHDLYDSRLHAMLELEAPLEKAFETATQGCRTLMRSPLKQ